MGAGAQDEDLAGQIDIWQRSSGGQILPLLSRVESEENLNESRRSLGDLWGSLGISGDLLNLATTEQRKIWGPGKSI